MIKRIVSLPILMLIFIWSHTVHSDTAKVLEVPIKTIDGRIVTLGELTGKKPVYLKFWASWCQPCREQMPHLQHAFEEYGEDIEIIAINLGVNDNVEAVLRTRKEFGLTVPIAIDENGELTQAFNLLGTPYHILLDKAGTVVHAGHDVTDDLNEKIKQLAADNSSRIPETRIEESGDSTVEFEIQENKPTILFFSAVWCGWYLEESRPRMSSNCIDAQHLVNELYTKHPHFNWHGVLTRLWTGDKELNEYRDKYEVHYPLEVDADNSTFMKFGVKKFPTLIVLNDGKEVFRVQDFSNPEMITGELGRLEN